MQIRTLDLTELDIIYELVALLRPTLSYETFEDLIYAMRHKEYTMFGLFNHDQLITYAGGFINVNLYWRRHLFIDDFITRPSHQFQGFGKAMLDYLHDYAKMMQCEHVALTSGFAREDAHAFYMAQGFERLGYTFVKSLNATT